MAQYVSGALRGQIRELEFDECQRTGSGSTDFDTDILLARSNGVRVVPTMFINSARVEGVRTADEIRRLIVAFADKK